MQLFLYNPINKRKVNTIISIFNVKLSLRNQSVLISHNSSIQHKTALCVYVTHFQFVKRFYPGGPKNFPKGPISSTSAPGNISKSNITNSSQTSSHISQKLTTTTSNNQNVSNNTTLGDNSFSHQKWPSANGPANNSTFGDGKMSPMEFAKQQAIKNAPVSTPTPVSHSNVDSTNPSGLTMTAQANLNSSSTLKNSSSTAIVPYGHSFKKEDCSEVVNQSSPLATNTNVEQIEEFIAVPSTEGLIPVNPIITSDPIMVKQVFDTFNVLTDARKKAMSDPILAEQLKRMHKRYLLQLGNSDYTTTAKFHTLLNKLDLNLPSKTEVLRTKDLVDIKNNFNVTTCVLQVTEDFTVILSSIQSHITLLYTIHNYKKIAWAYLTSEPENNLLLSQTQPFGDLANKPQYLRLMSKPIIIPETYIKPCSPDVVQQSEHYLRNPVINEKIREFFFAHMISKLYAPLDVYDGEGFSHTILDQVLVKFEEECAKSAREYFKENYIRSRKESPEKLKKFFDICKINRPYDYPYLLKLVNKYNEENDIKERYEIPKEDN